MKAEVKVFLEHILESIAHRKGGMTASHQSDYLPSKIATASSLRGIPIRRDDEAISTS